MKNDPQFGKAAVVGAGLMGSQIALILAQDCRKVALMSRRLESVQRAQKDLERYAADLAQHGLLRGGTPEEVLGRLEPTTSIEMAANGAEFIVESVPEDLSLKRAVLERLDQLAPPPAILASNTSGLPITDLASATQHPERVVGSHFVQPAHIVPLVEVVRGAATSDETMQATARRWAALGKIPLEVRVDVRGFVVNRLQHALVREANRLLAQGVASASDIDAAVSLGLAPRFMTAGPLEQRDINGLRMHAQVAAHLWPALDGAEEPLAFVQAKVERGEVGLDAGKGYYDWSGQDPTAVRRRKDELLIRWTLEVLEQLNEE
jgi:3-hydroxybutyryl-CoA dehydrogenase